MLTVDVIVFLLAQTLHPPQNEKAHKRVMDIACASGWDEAGVFTVYFKE